MILYDFCVEYRKEPAGLSVRVPRFSWKLESEEKDTVQKSYHIWVFLGEETIWDSGRKESAQSVLVPYGGKELEEEKEYRVRLVVGDNYGNSAESQTIFSTGIFDSSHL